MIDLLATLPTEWEALMKEWGEPAYRASQIFRHTVNGVPPRSMTNLPKALRERLEAEGSFRLPSIERKLTSAIDGTVKYLFRLFDGECVEGVLMHYRHGSTLCISSQVGCRMGCAFCASTLGGRVRDLYASELLGQVLAAAADSGERIGGIVMMGIGEPLDNYENVIRFLRLVNHPEGPNIGYRHISLSTCGLCDGILRLAEENLPITLSVSLHASTDEQRSALMPINKRYPIAELMAACTAYFQKTGRRISFEYSLVAGKNDGDGDAHRLASLLKSTVGRDGAPIHVNLIRVNTVEETGLRGPSAAAAARFAKLLCDRGITATVRRRLGADVNAACGQLRRTQTKEKAGIRAFAATDKGLCRKKNEDTYITERLPNGRHLVAVFDGMGGASAGEVASRIAGETFRELLQSNKKAEPAGFLRAAALHADKKIIAHQKSDPKTVGMGTTVTALFLSEDGAYSLNIGDSRTYRLRGDTLTRLTHDDSYVQTLIDAGELTEAEARRHPRRNVITAALGALPQRLPRVNFFTVKPGDIYLLCSDGLTSMVSEEKIKSILLLSATPQEKVGCLIAAANEGGGRDNITVSLLCV